MGRLQDKVAVVTGSAQGIGASYARALAGEGARVVVTDVLDPQACVDAIKATGGQAIGRRMDVTDSAALNQTIGEVESAFGPINILVNNAAIFSSLTPKPFHEITEDEWDAMMRVNVRGVFQACKAVLPSMAKAGGRNKIVNISSATFFLGPPNLLHYVASKAAIVGMTRSMARELGDLNINVNAIAPGFTESDSVVENPHLMRSREPNRTMRTIKRDMTPDDLLGTLVYLCSPDSDFVTGQLINVDGGKMMW